MITVLQQVNLLAVSCLLAKLRRYPAHIGGKTAICHQQMHILTSDSERFKRQFRVQLTESKGLLVF